MNRRTRGGLALAVGLLAAAGGVLAPVAAAPAEAAGTCSGVWVVVRDQGTGCATSYSTGKAALQSAGFTVRDKSPGFLCQINGFPQTCTVTNDEHWSYWHASLNADGTWGAWQYSNLGYTSYKPKKGDAEGWAFGAGLYGPQPPSPPAAPATTQPAATQQPTTAPATQKPTSAPTTQKPATQKPTSAATTAPQATRAATTTAPASSPSTPAQETTPPAPEASATPDATAPSSSPTPEPDATPTPADTATAAPATATPVDGSPVGVLVTLGVLVVGGGALGGWWWLRRRGA